MIFASVPVLEPPDALQDSWKHWVGCGSELLIVDSTWDRGWKPLASQHGWSYITFEKNLGVPAAWNIARAWFMLVTARPLDALFLFSSSVEFTDGLPAVLDQISAAANWKGCQTQLAGHGAAWSRVVFERCGSFDENFWIGYDGDCDWFYRLILEGLLVAGPDNFPRVEVHAPEVESGRTINRTQMISNTALTRELYKHKWGDEPSKETFTTPYDSGLPTWWWSPIVRGPMEYVNLGETLHR